MSRPSWLAPAGLSRLYVILVAAAGLMLVPLLGAPYGVRTLGTPNPISAFPDHLWLDGWARWDSAWYRSIAFDGYRLEDGIESNVAFFPLYPLVVKLFSEPLVGLGLTPERAFYGAGFAVSLAAFFVAVAGFQRLSRSIVGEPTTSRGLWLLCLGPWSSFFNAVYSESVFLALAVWAFVLLESKPRWAFLLAALAALTRSVGFVVAAGLFFQTLQAGRFRAAAWVLLPLVAVLGHLGYLSVQTGDPLAFLHVQGSPLWSRSFGWPAFGDAWSLAVEPGIPFTHRVAVLSQVAAVVLGVVGAAFTFGFGWGFGVFSVSSMGLIFFGGSWDSTGRYVSVVFPLVWVLARKLDSRSLVVVLFGSLILLTINVFGFTHWRQPF